MKKIMILAILFCSKAYSINEDFGVLTIKNSPLELLYVREIKINDLDKLIEKKEFDKLNKIILDSLPLITRQSILNAEKFAISNSKSITSFISNFNSHLQSEEGLIFIFYNNNISVYETLIGEIYDTETVGYYKRNYNDANSITRLIIQYWSSEVLLKITNAVSINPRNENKKVTGYLDSIGLDTLDNKVLFFLSKELRKMFRKNM